MPKVKINKVPLKQVRIKSLPKAANGLEVLNGGVAGNLSDNPIDGGMGIFQGNSHNQGGIDIAYGNKQAEVEGNEPFFTDQQGALQIFGKLRVPTMNKTFKAVAKDIAKEEDKYSKILDKSTALINSNDPYNRYEQLAFNSGTVMGNHAKNKQMELAAQKEQLAALQNVMLQSIQNSDKAKWGKKMNFAEGGDINSDEDPFTKLIKQRLAGVESGGNYNAIPKNKEGKLLSSAYGKYQFLKGTREGVYNKHFKNQYKSFEAFDSAFKNNTNNLQEDVMNSHISDLKKKYGENPTYIAAAHRIGEGATDQLIKTGKAKVGNRQITWDSPIGTSQDPTAQETLNQYIGKVIGNTLPTVDVTAPRLKPTVPAPDEKLPFPTVPSNNTSQPDITGNYPTAPMGDLDIPNKKRLPSLADQNKLSLGQIAPELLTLATERRQAVPSLNYTPTLYTPYQVSFQDQLNQNQATFSAVARQAGSSNPSALGTLAAQKYNADSEVLANQFRTNQGISNDITNKNVTLLNQAELQNLQFDDQQAVRQAQADANTRANIRGAVGSIANKSLQNRAENNSIRLYENMFNYRPDENLNLNYMGPDAVFTANGLPIGNSNQTSKTTYDKNGNPVRTSVTTPSQLKTNQDILNYNTNQRRAARKPFG